jgi:hypothetical protein
MQRPFVATHHERLIAFDEFEKLTSSYHLGAWFANAAPSIDITAIRSAAVGYTIE